MDPEALAAARRNLKDLELAVAAEASEDPWLRYAAARIAELRGEIRDLQDRLQAVYLEQLAPAAPTQQSH